jgi:hypothetical protein
MKKTGSVCHKVGESTTIEAIDMNDKEVASEMMM